MNTRGEGVWGKPDGWNWRARPGPEDRGQRDRRSGIKACVKTAGYAVRSALGSSQWCSADPPEAWSPESRVQTSRKASGQT